MGQGELDLSGRRGTGGFGLMGVVAIALAATVALGALASWRQQQAFQAALQPMQGLPPVQSTIPVPDHPGRPPGGSAALTPVDLGIPNLPQETQVWCWAAVAQQIILATRGPNATPPQCALVAAANNVPAETCCVHRDPRCVRTGSIPQIQSLIQHYAGRSSVAAGSADPMTLYNTLQRGSAVILGLQASPQSGHVVVVRGMAFDPAQGGEPFVYLNDPMGLQSQVVPFRAIAPYWNTAVIVN